MIPTFRHPRLFKLACALAGPLLLSQCGLMNSAASSARGAGGLLMTPVRLLQGTLGTLGAEAPSPGGPVSEEEVIRRADEIQRRGTFQGPAVPARSGASGALTQVSDRF